MMFKYRNEIKLKINLDQSTLKITLIFFLFDLVLLNKDFFKKQVRNRKYRIKMAKNQLSSR